MPPSDGRRPSVMQMSGHDYPLGAEHDEAPVNGHELSGHET